MIQPEAAEASDVRLTIAAVAPAGTETSPSRSDVSVAPAAIGVRDPCDRVSMTRVVGTGATS